MCQRHVEIHRQRMRLVYKPTESHQSKVLQANRSAARLEGTAAGKAADGRCRCGLLLPCNDCLPLSAAELPMGTGRWAE